MVRPTGNSPPVLDRLSGAACERWSADLACAVGLAEVALRVHLGDARHLTTADEVAGFDAEAALIVAVRELAVALMRHAIDGWPWSEVLMALASVDARREVMRRDFDFLSIVPPLANLDVKVEVVHAMHLVILPGPFVLEPEAKL